MLDTLLSGAYAPFSLAIALLFGLLALELVFAIMGATLMGDGAGEIDADLDVDLDADFDADFSLDGLADFDLDADIEGLDIASSEFDAPAADDISGEIDGATAATPGALAWLGLGKVPTLIWIAAFLLGFGAGGILLQNAAAAIWAPLPAFLAVPPTFIAALWFARGFGGVFARVLPKTETQAVSQNSLARRKGVVTQGTAKRGAPAEVRVTDRYGNKHYLRAEPLQDDAEILEGAEVLVLRHRPSGGFRLLALLD